MQIFFSIWGTTLYIKEVKSDSRIFFQGFINIKKVETDEFIVYKHLLIFLPGVVLEKTGGTEESTVKNMSQNLSWLALPLHL